MNNAVTRVIQFNYDRSDC